VLDFILELKRDLISVICLRGNHEEMFLDFYLEQKNGMLFLWKGLRSTFPTQGVL